MKCRWAPLIQYSSEQVEEDKIEKENSAEMKLNSKNVKTVGHVVCAGEQQNANQKLLNQGRS